MGWNTPVFLRRFREPIRVPRIRKLSLCSSPARGIFMFFIWKHGPPACLAHRLVLSQTNGYKKHYRV